MTLILYLLKIVSKYLLPSIRLLRPFWDIILLKGLKAQGHHYTTMALEAILALVVVHNVVVVY